MLVQAFDFKGQDVKAAFKVGDPRFEGFVAGARGLLEQSVNGNAGHFRDAANAAREAEFAEFLVFLRREAEADHAVSGFKRHERKAGS